MLTSQEAAKRKVISAQRLTGEHSWGKEPSARDGSSLLFDSLCPPFPQRQQWSWRDHTAQPQQVGGAPHLGRASARSRPLSRPGAGHGPSEELGRRFFLGTLCLTVSTPGPLPAAVTSLAARLSPGATAELGSTSLRSVPSNKIFKRPAFSKTQSNTTL